MQGQKLPFQQTSFQTTEQNIKKYGQQRKGQVKTFLDDNL